MARIGFDGNDVAFLQVQLVHIMVVALTGVLELHFHKVCGIDVARHVSQPVVSVQLTVLSTYGVLAKSTVTAGFHHIVFFHCRLVFF